MSKLQLYVARYQQGYTSIANCNPRNEIQYEIGNLRSTLESINYDANEIHTFCVAKSLPGASLLTIARTLPPQKGDHIAATIAISNEIYISGRELLDLISNTREILCREKITQQEIAELEQLYSKDYVELATSLKLPSTESTDYAYLEIGEDSAMMFDLAEAKFFQPEFASYAGVLLLDVEKGYASTLRKLEMSQIRRMSILRAPSKTAENFIPYINNLPFTNDLFVPYDSEQQIIWTRSGYEREVQTVIVNGDDFSVELPDTKQARKRLTPSFFFISSRGRTLNPEECKIVVNDCELEDDNLFTYEELTNAKIEVEAEGYAPYEGRMDLATIAQAMVQLKSLRKVYKFSLPIYTPDPVDAIQFVIRSKKSITESPLEGYDVPGGDLCEGESTINHLVFVGVDKKKQIITGIIGVLVGLVIGIVIMVVVRAFGSTTEQTTEPNPQTEAVTSSEESDPETSESTPQANESNESVAQTPVATPAETPEQPTVNTPAETPVSEPTSPVQNASFDVSSAVKYLDDNFRWNRDEMAKNPGLEGLFDDLNTYNFEHILTYWEPLLNKSKRFNKVVIHIKGSKTKKSPARGNHSPTYLKPGDHTINMNGYLNHIDP